MSERKLESRILYCLVFILIIIVLTLISLMPFSLLDIKLDKEILSSISTFFGALLGALITGATAIGILFHQKHSDSKEVHFRNYGSMKYIAIKLVIYPELQKLSMVALSVIQNPPSPYGKPGWERELLSSLPINEFNKLILLLKQEREKIPYEFVSRYFTVINQLEYLVGALERVRQDHDEIKINNALRQLELGEDISRRFRDNLFEFILQIEKKYDIKDAY